MQVLDATSLAERLKWEAKEYWLHLDADTPLEKYPAKQHARRVQEKLGAEAGLVYLLGQPAKNNEDSDMPAAFRQRRYFYYMSGCDWPDCHLAYDIQRDTLSLFIPRIDQRRVIYNGPGLSLAEALVKYDVDEVYYADELLDFIEDWSHENGNRGSIFALHESQIPRLPLKLQEKSIVVDVTSLQPAMNIARMIKDDHEINLIRKANDISSRAHKEVLANIRKFKNEAQVEGLFLDVCVSRHAKHQAYDPIAASGPNAGTLHYDANNEDFEDRQLICLDAGCEYQLYASDVTRTFPLSGSWPSKEARNIYRLVERMQESCIARIAPGVRYLDLHILAHQIAIDGLLQLGILHNGTKEEIYRAGTSKAFFLHGLGHHIGLDVHDVGQAELMSVRRGKAVATQIPSLYPEDFHLPVYDAETCLAPTDPQSSHLEEGMVVTVEPGIYFSVYALHHIYLPSPIHSKYINAEVVQRYLPIGGVRIEDDILVTSKGYENLTTAPKGDAMLRIIQSGQADADKNFRVTNSTQRRNSEEAPALLRAPGILSEQPASILQPISRAATMPPELHQRDSIDFEPFNGPSLFSNFRRSMTTDERIRHWKKTQEPSSPDRKVRLCTKPPNTICGEATNTVKHVHMTVNNNNNGQSLAKMNDRELPICKKCTVLCETLGRLRQNLVVSVQSSPISEPSPTFATTTKKKISAKHQGLDILNGQTAKSPPLGQAEISELPIRVKGGAKMPATVPPSKPPMPPQHIPFQRLPVEQPAMVHETLPHEILPMVERSQHENPLAQRFYQQQFVRKAPSKEKLTSFPTPEPIPTSGQMCALPLQNPLENSSAPVDPRWMQDQRTQTRRYKDLAALTDHSIQEHHTLSNNATDLNRKIHQATPPAIPPAIPPTNDRAIRSLRQRSHIQEALRQISAETCKLVNQLEKNDNVYEVSRHDKQSTHPPPIMYDAINDRLKHLRQKELYLMELLSNQQTGTEQVSPLSHNH